MTRRSNEALLERVRVDGDESSAHALLDAFFSGFPVERLREVLSSDSLDAVRAGAWLASELGAKAAPLLADLAILLGHPSRYVRFFSLDGVLMGATERDGAAIARAVELVNDEDSAVRWKATNFLARATSAQLGAALPYLPDSTRNLITQLLSLEEGADETAVRELLHSSDENSRLLGVVAALRRSNQDATLIRVAASSPHNDVSEIAKEWLAVLTSRRP